MLETLRNKHNNIISFLISPTVYAFDIAIELKQPVEQF